MESGLTIIEEETESSDGYQEDDIINIDDYLLPRKLILKAKKGLGKKFQTWGRDNFTKRLDRLEITPGENPNQSSMGDELAKVDNQDKIGESDLGDQEDQYNPNGAGSTNIRVATTQDKATGAEIELENLGADLEADLPGFQTVSSPIPKITDNQKHLIWDDQEEGRGEKEKGS